MEALRYACWNAMTSYLHHIHNRQTGSGNFIQPDAL